MKISRTTHILSLIVLGAAALPVFAQASSAGKPDRQERQQSAPGQKEQKQSAPDPRQQRAADSGRRQDSADQQSRQRATAPRKQQAPESQKRQQRAAEPQKQQRVAEPQKQKAAAEPKRQKGASDRQQKPHEAGKPAETADSRPRSERKFTLQPLPNHTPEQTREWQQKKAWTHNGGWQGRNSWREHRSDNWGRDHRSWAQRGGYGGYYIPQDYYVMYFGPVHYFRFQRAPVIYWGYPRFYYQDISFIMVDPWPMTWQENWYENDDVYIEYNDGYYLYNRREPTVAIAINIVID